VALRTPPKIYYIHPAIVGPLDKWSEIAGRAKALGFDWIAAAPIFAPGKTGDIFLAGDTDRALPIFGNADADDVAERLVKICRQHELKLMTDVVVDRVDPAGALATTRFDLFASPTERPADPRSASPLHAAYARLDGDQQALVDFWRDRLLRLLEAGVGGFRFLSPQTLTSFQWRKLLDPLRGKSDDLIALAWTPGLRWSEIEALAGADFDGVFSSVAWWDGRAPWFVEEYDILRRVAPVLGCPEAPFNRRLIAGLAPEANIGAVYRGALRISAAIHDGFLVPQGFEYAVGVAMDPRRSTPADLDDGSARKDLRQEVQAANALIDHAANLGTRRELRALTGPEDETTVLVRFDAPDARNAHRGLVIEINSDYVQPRKTTIGLDPLPPSAGAPFLRLPLDRLVDPEATLNPGEVRLHDIIRASEARQRPRGDALGAAMLKPRIAIERIAPAVDSGRFATKRLIGDRVTVEADIFIDGHGAIAADVLWKAADEREWRRVAMRMLDNDRWVGSFTPERIGRHVFTIEAWSDVYASLARDVAVKAEAGADYGMELEEARTLITETLKRADGEDKAALTTLVSPCSTLKSGQAPPPTSSLDAFLSPKTKAAMRGAAARQFVIQHKPTIPIEVERPQAGIGAWYEMFPRSSSPRPGDHGRFADVIRRLPYVRAMGFDVLYFPPIHPIGKTHRKGPNNNLNASPDDAGSPYAIGSTEGGHEALHPELGTFEDFAQLQAAAAEHGLEIALDFAVQCSLDHPWLKQHPDWFRWRSDGSIRFAENPPKKYEDIVNVEFYRNGAGVPEVWTALRDVVLFWVDHGVRIFRVDNPHTKPLPYWEWMIADVRARFPDVTFLAEAFTRPKMMYRLAKLGFSQSYTYFTWRNSKRELTEYLTELSAPPVSDYFRPNFFVNTPDINPHFLQNSGRAGFLIRAALAATLSALWGMYSGFELCEGAALPGREEYLDSEKYEIKSRDYNAPGNIVAEIAKLNRIRKSHPALQQQAGLTFYTAYHDQVIIFEKSLPNHRDAIVVAVNLDPFHPHDATFEIPLWRMGLPDDAVLGVNDLMRDRYFVWTGGLQHVRLDPGDLPFAIWHVGPLSEHRR
jgi:starch synthase (maltosyl-transferring)